MKIYDAYPEEVEIGGRVIALNLDFSRVLRVLDIQEQADLTPLDKLELQATLLLRDPSECPDSPKEQAELVNAAFSLLPKKGDTSGERYIDFDQDAALIRSAFFRIGVDLSRDRLHILQFLELLADLPSDTALMRTVEIRAKPLPKPTKHNADQIAALQKAKARVAINVSEEERRARFAESLKRQKL